MLNSAIAQDTGGEFTFEVLVVDNNSTDKTRSVVESFANNGKTPVHYLFEGRQGKSFALNSGLSEIKGNFFAIVDDDLILPPNYLKTVYEAINARPEIAIFGGRVLPLWRSEVPSWLDEIHWSAIAMADYGDSELVSDRDNPITLLAGIYRTKDVKAVGGYHNELGVTKGKIGGTEDADLHTRLWSAGKKGLYLPELFLYHKVEPHRLTKAYHRKWNIGHGAYFALMKDDEFERSSARIFDIPLHIFREATVNSIKMMTLLLTGNRDEAFLHETKVRFFWGYSRQRLKDFHAEKTFSVAGEISSIPRLLLRRFRGGGTQEDK